MKNLFIPLSLANCQLNHTNNANRTSAEQWNMHNHAYIWRREYLRRFHRNFWNETEAIAAIMRGKWFGCGDHDFIWGSWQRNIICRCAKLFINTYIYTHMCVCRRNEYIIYILFLHSIFKHYFRKQIFNQITMATKVRTIYPLIHQTAAVCIVHAKNSQHFL